MQSFKIALITLVVFLFTDCAIAGEAGVAVMRVPNNGIYPQLQVDSRGRVHLIYFKGDAQRGDIFYIRSDDGGRTFTPPIRVNSQPNSALIIGIVRGPHLAIGKNDRAHVAWMGSNIAEPKATGKAIPMLYARLNDAGDAFEPQRNVIGEHPGLDGGGSIAADRDGNVYIAWHAPIDHRNEREEDRTVWLTRSSDEGRTLEPESRVFDTKLGACACCGMRIFAAADGRVFVTVRSAVEKVNRDIHVFVSADHGKTFTDIATDPWKIGTCVMSTAAFAQAGDRGVIAAWETQEQVRVTRFNDDPTKTAVPASIPGDAKKRKHPSIAVNARGESLIAWTEGLTWGKGGSVVWQIFDSSGRPIPGASGRADDLPTWSIPAAFVTPDGSFGVIY